MREASSLFLVTGTWGVGKTRILELLEPEFHVVEEPGRKVAKSQEAFEPGRFTQAVTDITKAVHTRLSDETGIWVFDRGMVDCLAYARWFGLDEDPYRALADELRYHVDVFFFPFWGEIYRTDTERKATPEQARAFEQVLIEVVGECGYNLTRVPLGGPEERAEFLRDELRTRIREWLR